MKKTSNIYVTLTNDIANFKVRLPWNWLQKLGLTETDKEICISYKDKKLVISKAKEVLFANLSKHEKVLQIKKYEQMNGYKYDRVKDLMEEMEEYFKVTYRTIYRYSKENVSLEELENVQLIQEQNENAKNVNIILNNTTSALTIPTNLAVLFLQEKRYEELGITNATQIYGENINIPITLTMEDNFIYIEKE